MTTEHKLFAIVVWFGIVSNWAFGLWALFLDPHRLLALFGLPDVASTLWLYNYATLLLLLSLFYIPAAQDPFRYRINAWLLIVARLVPASGYVLGVLVGFMPGGILAFGVSDATIGLLELVLLVRLYRAEPVRSRAHA